MEEQKTEGRTFTEKEVMDIVGKMQQDFTAKLSQSNNILTRLNFLFKVIENKEAFINSKKFIEDCTQEIIDIMTISDKEETNNKE